MSEYQLGRIILLGSGETSPSIRKTYDWLFQQLETPVHVSILETPAGFEPNSEDVAQQIGDYLEKHLQNYRPEISLIPARKRGTPYSTDDPSLLEPFYSSNVILMGPGSPTYTVRQLKDSVAWQAMHACHRLGADLIFASAATLACSLYTIPVYEIYKVGEDLHWKDGLNFFAAFGLRLVFVSHWNNNDGGTALDTSRCYLGQDRFTELIKMLNESQTEDYRIVGIDENTALIVDPNSQTCQVMGPGGVTILPRGTLEMDEQQYFASGESFPLSLLGEFEFPGNDHIISDDIWEHAQKQVALASTQKDEPIEPPEHVLALLEERNLAREQKDWAKSDSLRDEIAAIGWNVQDTRNGSTLELIEA